MPAKTVAELMREGRAALGLHTDTGLADFLGISRRTVYRNHATGGFPTIVSQTQFVRALHAVDPVSARTLANAFHVDIADLEAKLAPPPARPVAVTKEHLALITLAAADATNMVPRDVRPALAAIFGAALELGVDLNELGKLLAPANKKSTSA